MLCIKYKTHKWWNQTHNLPSVHIKSVIIVPKEALLARVTFRYLLWCACRSSLHFNMHSESELITKISVSRKYPDTFIFAASKSISGYIFNKFKCIWILQMYLYPDTFRNYLHPDPDTIEKYPDAWRLLNLHSFVSNIKSTAPVVHF